LTSLSSSSNSSSWKDTDTALAECEEEAQQLLGSRVRDSNVPDSCAEDDAGPFAAAGPGLGMQQEMQADTSSVFDGSTHKPPWQQQQQMLSRRLTSSSTTSGSQHGQQLPGTSRSSLVRRRVTVASTPPTAAAAAAAAAAEDDDEEPFKSVSSVPSWVFGARQQLQQHTQARASKRLHGSSKARKAAEGGVRLHPRQEERHKLTVLVAGYSTEEAANDLLQLLLEFAPAGSSVVIAVAADSATAAAAAAAEDQGQQQQQQPARQQLPEGLDWEGQLEAEEEPQHAGAAPVLHSIDYRY
jgi:hypothetical protein